MKKKQSLLIFGAAGGVGTSFLQRFSQYRKLVGNIILLDKKKLTRNTLRNFKLVNYKFIQKKIILPTQTKEYQKYLKSHDISIVIDVTDSNTMPILEATDAVEEISYINTGINCDGNLQLAIYNLIDKKHTLKGAPHIIGAGMNPGVVNLLVCDGIRTHGVPQLITHFEYDSSQPAFSKKPAVTWSIKEFIAETLRDPAGYATGKNSVKEFYPNPLIHNLSMKNILAPIIKLNRYPHGMLVLHEENITIAQKYNVPSRFLYAIHPETFKQIKNLYNNNKNLKKADFNHINNVKQQLKGEDTVGVALEYPDKIVYYVNSLKNSEVCGTNATYSQVATGLCGALITLLYEKIDNGVLFTEDLYDTFYKDYIFNNLTVVKYIFEKRNHGFKLRSKKIMGNDRVKKFKC